MPMRSSDPMDGETAKTRANPRQIGDTVDELPFCPIDFHCHGVGKFDFTDVPELSLDAVEQSLRREKVRSILTLYLPQHHYRDFLQLVQVFDCGRREGRYRYIAGL